MNSTGEAINTATSVSTQQHSRERASKQARAWTAEIYRTPVRFASLGAGGQGYPDESVNRARRVGHLLYMVGNGLDFGT